MARILIADEHDTLRHDIADALRATGHVVTEAPNGSAALGMLQEHSYDLVVSDITLNGTGGTDLLKTIRAKYASTDVILMTAFGSIRKAVDAMQLGAFDYVAKPFDNEEMKIRIARAIEHRRLKHEIDYLRHTQPAIYDLDRIIGAHGSLKPALHVVRKVAASNTTVLIRGETGTGKEIIAAAVHHNSPRASRSFVKVNCAALQDTLIESELFGHEKGAFTGADRQRVGRFEQADGGTLFLDEIGDMSQNTQSKVLRVLQEHEFDRLGGTRPVRVDVRLIAATHRNLAHMVLNGQFREDLYYRLNVVSIQLPPLRERKDDILPLAEFFIARFSGELKKKGVALAPDALRLLVRHTWPGNIRELENAIEHAVLLSDGGVLTAADLYLGDESSSGDAAEGGQVVTIPARGMALEDIERQVLVEALRMSRWVQKDAADLLRITPRVMNYKIKMLKIEYDKSGQGGERTEPEPDANAGHTSAAAD